MNVQVFNARNANALATIKACVNSLSVGEPALNEAVQVLDTIVPGDQDVYSLYHREACAAALKAACTRLQLPVNPGELVDVQAVVDALTPAPEVDAPEGEGDAEPA